MKKFRQEIAELSHKGDLIDAEFEASVLSSVTAHLAEATPNEESYYTLLAKLELSAIPDILKSSTIISGGFFGDSFDPLQELRDKINALKTKLLSELPSCVEEIKTKTESKALKCEDEVRVHEKTILENSSAQEKLSDEAIETLKKRVENLQVSAESLRTKKESYNRYQTELNSFIGDPKIKISQEVSVLLGQLRRYVSTHKELPQSYSDWNTLVINALSLKLNESTLKVTTSLLNKINQYQETVEKVMRTAMLDRTTVSNAQQMVSHLSRTATEVNAEKEKEKRAKENAERLAQEQKEAREIAEQLVEKEKEAHKKAKDDNDRLQNELETRSRRTINNGLAIAASERQHGAQDPFNDMIGMLEFWSIERTFLIIVIMSEYRRQKDYIVRNADGKDKGSYPNAEAVSSILARMVMRLAQMQTEPVQAIQELKTTKVLNGTKRQHLQAVAYLGRLAQVFAKYDISFAKEKYIQYLPESLNSRYEYMQRLKDLFADNGHYSLLPFDNALTLHYQKTSESLIPEVAALGSKENNNVKPSAEEQKKLIKKSIEDRKYEAAKAGDNMLTRQIEESKTINLGALKLTQS